MEPEVRQAPLHYYEIDLLRFIAALSVMLYHYTYTGVVLDHLVAHPYIGTSITRYGYLGVELFFLVSGYVVLKSAYGKTLRHFVVSRISRLYPAFWVACTLTVLVPVLIRALGITPALATFSWTQYLYNLTMLHDFFGKPALSGVYWTLTQELTFYFLISLCIGYNLWPQLPYVLAGWLLYTCLTGPLAPTTPFSLLFIPKYSSYFISGMLFYLVQNKLGNRRLLVALLAVSWLVSLRTANAVRHELDVTFQGQPAYNGMVTLVLVCVMYLVFIAIITRQFNLARFSWLATAGGLTYPLYLLHGVCGTLFKYLAVNQYVALVLVSGSALLVAYVLQRWVEKPMSKWLRARLQPAPVLASKTLQKASA